MDQKKLDRIVLRYLLMAAAVVLAVRYFAEIAAFIGTVWDVLGPLVIGAIMAYVLNLVMKVVEKCYFPNSKKPLVVRTRRPMSIVIAIFLIGAAAVFIVQMVVPELVSAFQVVFSALPAFLENVEAFILEVTENNPSLQQWIVKYISDIKWDEIDWVKTAQTLLGFASTGVSSILSSAISILAAVFGGVVQFVISLIFAIYILANKERLASQGQRILQAYLRERDVARIDYVLATAHETFSSFIGGQCVEAVILGSLCAAGMWILQLPYAPMVGAFVGVTALIPIVGAYLGAAVGAFMILTVNPVQAVVFVVYLLILQQVEGNVIYPRVVGASIGLPGLWVLAAVTVGGGLGGIPGMLLGVPLAATLYRLLSHDVKVRIRKKAVRSEQIDEETTAAEDTGEGAVNQKKRRKGAQHGKR